MYGYKCRAHAAASSLPCAHHVQGEYCRYFEMVFIYTIAATLNRHIQTERQIYSLIFPTDFSFKLFLKQDVSPVLHPLIWTAPTWYYLSTMPFYTNTNRVDKADVHKHTDVHTHRGYTATDALTFPTATRRVMHAHPASGRHRQHPPGKAEQLHGTGRHAIIRTQAHSPALSQTHLHTSLYLFPQHTHSSFGAVPLHWLMMPRQNFARAGNGKAALRREEGGQGRDFLLYFAQGFYLYFFFWQTRIPFELIHFFLPRILNDNA